MVLKDQVKNYARKLTENKPAADTLASLLRPAKPLTRKFGDDGIIPNNSRWPLVIYRRAIRLDDDRFKPEAVIDAILESNGWGRSWRDTIYDFVHYHSQVHEVLGVAKGSARVEFGGVKGRTLTLQAGDVAILPAGTGHRLIDASRNFLVVGAYPPEGTYDECTDSRDRPDAIKRIAKVKRPKTDPVFGRNGPLTDLWAANKS